MSGIYFYVLGSIVVIRTIVSYFLDREMIASH
ncbi:DUF1622 domain-containing protein [Patescibacteria group bacterium]|nr:DUF1622 domain-containing protein [Patescibacteria group bacterium]